MLRSISPPILSAFTPYHLFQLYPPSTEILLNLSMKCWNSAFIAQGSILIIVVVRVGAGKIYGAVVEALRKKERGDETQFGSQLFRFVKFHSQLRIWGPIMPKLAVLAP
jgi:hypothetical protein